MMELLRIFAGLVTLAICAHADGLRVVTTIPDLAWFANAIGGELVDATSIAKGPENIHTVRVKPSHIIALSKADVFIEMGLSMEHAWVPSLLMTARNKRIQAGAAGFINVSEGWKAREVPTSLSRRQGVDLHPEGNPHFNLDPRGGRHMAERVFEGLVRVAPNQEARFRAGYERLLGELDAAEARWAKIGTQLAGHTVATYHTEFTYLLAAYELELVATIEPQPGVPPTPKHLIEVATTMRERETRVILTATWSKGSYVEEVAKRVDAVVVEMPSMCMASGELSSWIAMMDRVHTQLARALKEEQGAR